MKPKARARYGSGSVRPIAGYPDRWRLRWRDASGQRERKYHGTREEAERELDREMRAANPVRPGSHRELARVLTVGSYLGSWIEAKRLAPRSRERYAHVIAGYIVPELGRKRLEHLSVDDLTVAVAHWRANGASDATIAFVITVLRTALKRAEELELVPRNVARFIDKPAVDKRRGYRIPDAHLEAIMRDVAGTPWEACYAIAIETGIRQGELLGLRWRDIDLARGTIDVNGQRQYGSDDRVRLKTIGSRRILRLSPATLELLAREAGEPDAYVIATSRGTPRDARNVLRDLVERCDRLGIRRFRWHDFRHTAATRFHAATGNLQATSELLGHASIATTSSVYVHLDTADLDLTALAVRRGG